MTSGHRGAAVEVVAGIIRDPAGRLLLDRRPPGKPLAGQWEFPGGKIQAGETRELALVRELREEHGISVQRQQPLIGIDHDYSDRKVRLHVAEILAYRGEPRGREGQELRWVAAERLGELDLLAANAPVARAAMLPRWCLISDLGRFGLEATLERLAWHVGRRRCLLVVREKSLAPGMLDEFLARACRITRGTGSLVLVHADCGISTCREAAGVHLPAARLAAGGLPEHGGLRGASCHNATEIRAAETQGLDYAFLSPVKPTGSHPEARVMGWADFALLCRGASIPVYALGGLDESDFDTAVAHGAQGVAMLSAAWR